MSFVKATERLFTTKKKVFDGVYGEWVWRYIALPETWLPHLETRAF